MAILLAAVAVLIPLVIAPGLLFYFDVTPKVIILLAGTAAALLMMPRRKAPVPSLSKWFLALLAIYVLALLLSTIRSTDWQLSLIGANWRRFGLLTHVAALSFAAAALFTLAGRSEARLLLLRAIAGGGLIASGYGTLQYFGCDPWLPNGSYTIGEGEWAIIRPPATLGHASYAATYYLFAAFAGLGITRADTRRIWRSIGTAAAVLGTFAIVLSGTRAAVLGLLAGSAVFMLLSPPRWKGRAAVLGLITLASFGVFYYSPAGEKLRARMRWSIEDTQGGARLLLWRDSLRMAATRPILGWGPETFTREFPKFQSKELAQAYPDFYHESPHNIFLDTLLSSGILGLSALLGLCGIGLYAGHAARRQAPAEASALTAALTAGIAAQQFTAFTVPTAFYLYLTIAVLISMAAGNWPLKIQRPWTAAAIPAILLLGFAARIAVADHYLLRARKAIERNDLRTAASAFQHASQWQRPGASSDLWYSRALAASARNATLILPGIRALQEAHAAAERATQTAEDRHNAYYNLATYFALRDDFSGVEASLREAIDQAPNWFKPHWTLAQSLQLAGRLDEAEREATLADALAGAKYPEVTRTLQDIQQQRALK